MSRPVHCLLFSSYRTTSRGPMEPRGEARAPAQSGRTVPQAQAACGQRRRRRSCTGEATRQHSQSTLSPLGFQLQDQPKGPPPEAGKTGSSNATLDSPACTASPHSSLPSGKMRMGNLLLSCTCSVSLQKREMEGRVRQSHVHHHPCVCQYPVWM